MTPTEFAEAVLRLHVEYDHDIEMRHAATDALMEGLLCELGYHDGVDLLSEVTRWYA